MLYQKDFISQDLKFFKILEKAINENNIKLFNKLEDNEPQGLEGVVYLSDSQKSQWDEFDSAFSVASGIWYEYDLGEAASALEDLSKAINNFKLSIFENRLIKEELSFDDTKQALLNLINQGLLKSSDLSSLESELRTAARKATLSQRTPEQKALSLAKGKETRQANKDEWEKQASLISQQKAEIDKKALEREKEGLLPLEFYNDMNSKFEKYYNIIGGKDWSFSYKLKPEYIDYKPLNGEPITSKILSQGS